MRYLIKHLKLFLPCLLLLLFQNCTDSTTEPQKGQEIIFGKSIEGVFIGDDSLTVINKLGEPTGIMIGDFRGYALEYDEGDLKHTSVTISTDEVFGLGVIGIHVREPYQGKSKEGIGIGSSQEFVVNKLGIADKTFNQTQYLLDVYFYGDKRFDISYENHKIISISMSKRRPGI